MSTLGEILEQLRDPSEVRQLILQAGDIVTVAGLDKASHDQGVGSSQLALRAVEAFTHRADDEAWAKLIGRIQDAESPAAACLSEMLRWATAH